MTPDAGLYLHFPASSSSLLFTNLHARVLANATRLSLGKCRIVDGSSSTIRASIPLPACPSEYRHAPLSDPAVGIKMSLPVLIA